MSRAGLMGMLVVLAGSSGALPIHAQTAAHASCQGKELPRSIADARAAMESEPEELGPRIRLADALVDQGCYADAVTVLEGGQAMHPHSIELTGKLRDVRSMLTEQTYIQGLTQAQDAAELQHNQLRCTKLGDLDACHQALKSTPDDVTLLIAEADGLMQGGHGSEAVDVYQRAAHLSPGNESLQAKLAAAQAREKAASATPQTTPPVAATDQPPAGETPAVAPAAASRLARPAAAKVAAGSRAPAPARVAAAGSSVPPTLEPAPAPSYSNDAPAGRSN